MTRSRGGTVPLGNPVVGWTPPQALRAQNAVGRYVELAPLEANAHAVDLFTAYQGHDQVWDYLPYGPFASAAALGSWISDATAGGDVEFHALRRLDQPGWHGVASYLRIMPQSGSIEVGHLNFSPSLQRTAAATEAMYLMMQRAFEAGYRRCEWKCDALNVPSRRAAQRLGFSFEGVFRQATVVKNRNRDTAWFAIIDTEWPALKAAFEGWLAETDVRDAAPRSRLSDLTAPLLAATDPSLVSR